MNTHTLIILKGERAIPSNKLSQGELRMYHNKDALIFDVDEDFYDGERLIVLHDGRQAGYILRPNYERFLMGTRKKVIDKYRVNEFIITEYLFETNNGNYESNLERARREGVLYDIVRTPCACPFKNELVEAVVKRKYHPSRIDFTIAERIFL